jgi:hypothetical protein
MSIMIIFLTKLHRVKFENPKILYKSMCLEFFQNVLNGLQTIIVELLYVKKVHGYFEVF